MCIFFHFPDKWGKFRLPLSWLSIVSRDIVCLWHGATRSFYLSNPIQSNCYGHLVHESVQRRKCEQELSERLDKMSKRNIDGKHIRTQLYKPLDTQTRKQKMKENVKHLTYRHIDSEFRKRTNIVPGNMRLRRTKSIGKICENDMTLAYGKRNIERHSIAAATANSSSIIDSNSSGTDRRATGTIKYRNGCSSRTLHTQYSVDV